MEYKVYYNGQETSDFDTLAVWFQELKKENKKLKEANEQYRDDYTRLKLGYDEFKLRNRDLESDIDILKSEKRKTEDIIKKYCGDDYVDAPIPTMVGNIIKDYFYQKNETECQVKALQKAEKTIDKLNEELVEYADKVEKLEKCACSIPTFPTLAEKINELEKKNEELTTENKRLKYSQPWMYGMFCPSRVAYLNSVFGVNDTIHKLREENNKLKDALEFCQKEASSAREHAHNVEVNAERIREELD